MAKTKTQVNATKASSSGGDSDEQIVSCVKGPLIEVISSTEFETTQEHLLEEEIQAKQAQLQALRDTKLKEKYKEVNKTLLNF